MAGDQLSYVCGTSDRPLMFTTIVRMFNVTTKCFDNRGAVTVCHQNIHWPYPDLKKHVDTCAAGLIALGLKPGERVGTWSLNNHEWLAPSSWPPKPTRKSLAYLIKNTVKQLPLGFSSSQKLACQRIN